MGTSTEPRNGAEILRAGVSVLTDHLPSRWEVGPVSAASDAGLDAVVRVAAPDGRAVDFVLEIKRSVESRDVPTVREQLGSVIGGRSGAHGVVVAKYLSPPVRERLQDAGISYVDATGNVRVDVDVPGLFMLGSGADRDPWRGPGRPRGTLKGAPAAKVVRALIDVDREWTIRDLIRESGSSTGSTYRVAEFLADEELIVRTDTGGLVVPRWSELLRRWSADYGFVRSSVVTRWIAPRGLPTLLERAAGSAAQYAVTGTIAAASWAEYAPPRNAMVYVEDSARCAQEWGLRATESGVNVLLAEPSTDVVFARSLANDAGVTCAAPAQVAVDLLTGPGRSPSEAEELIEWMVRNEPQWRRR
ncbi:type IV toxin-antitoxin system AbiEi family antitoxin [Prescottella subtropica]|uniref:type IV toxin-antitoxin system AbiEi family antitoxin n=1 Tax=Prescottella subtropica TaxID=2545757 RepID=UPI0010FA3135|nr:type IV toxin-antitoxin system AbiEi family antitoxin [Prescottella subtropica]